MEFSPNKRRLIEDNNVPAGVQTRIYSGNSFPIFSKFDLPLTRNNVVSSSVNNYANILNLPPLPNKRNFNLNNNNKYLPVNINIDNNYNHINNNNINNNDVIKKKRGNNPISNAILQWIQQKADQIKQMFPDMKIKHKEAISLASEEYRNVNGTIRAKKLSKPKRKKKNQHVCPNCNYKF